LPSNCAPSRRYGIGLEGLCELGGGSCPRFAPRPHPCDHMGWWLRKALRRKVPSIFSCVGCPSTHGACTIINCSSRSVDLANRRDSQALINAYSMREFRAKVIAPTLSQLQPIHRERIDAKRRSMVQIARDNSHNSLCYEMRLSFALTIGAAFERNLRLWLLFGLSEHRPVIERVVRRSLFKLDGSINVAISLDL
jgi:hypothetical protein